MKSFPISVSFELLSIFVFGIGFCVATLYLALILKTPSEFTSFVLRVIFSVALSALSSCMPPAINIKSSTMSVGFGIFVFFASFFANPPSLLEASSISQIQKSVDMGRTLINRGKYEDARRIFSRLRTDKPKYVEGNFYLGIIEKINGRYAIAEDLFQDTERLLKSGGMIATDLDEADVLYEVAMMKDGQLSTLSAIDEFKQAKQLAPLDGYVEGDIEFEIARLQLFYWIKHRSSANYHFLQDATNAFEADEKHDTPNRLSKLWTWYHLSCAYSEQANFSDDPRSIQKFEKLASMYGNKFSSEADALQGGERFNFLLSVFMAYNNIKEYIPGTPLACGTPIPMDQYFLNR